MRERISGVGLYIRGLSRKTHGTPAQAAKRAKDHGIRFVYIMSVWQDYKNGKFRHLRGNLARDRMRPYAEAFAEAGIKVGLWFYPWGGHEERLLDDLAAACESMPISGLLDDGELGHKWKAGRSQGLDTVGTMRGGQREAMLGVSARGNKRTRIAQVERLWDGLEALSEEHRLPFGVGATAYGVADFHKTFPWEAKLTRADWLSPQLYTATPAFIDRGIRQWYKHAGQSEIPFDKRKDLIASIGTYGKNSGARMHEHLSCFVDGEESLDGFIAWSWRQTDAGEWRTLARWADWIQRGICAPQ